MMRKLIAILFILAAVNVANAGYVDLVISSLDGQPITQTQEIYIFPSDVIGVDVVYTPEAQGWSIIAISKEMVISPQGSMTANLGVSISTPFNPGLIIWNPGWHPDLSRITIISDPKQGKVGDPLIDIVANDVGSVATGIVLDHFLLHCEGPFDVLVKLMENPNTEVAWESLESDEDWNWFHLGEGPGIIIHQTPEPMTITLLGLGGLAILRKRSA
jgi:hypothetical protein